MKSKEYYIDNITMFVNEYFPGTNGILLTGSFNTPYFNDTSDLDIILLSEWHRDSFVESYNYNGLKIQVIMLPLHDMDGILYRDVARGRGAIISMFAKGMIIKDCNNLLKRLIQQCIVLYERGPQYVQLDLIDHCRAKITSCLEDIEGSNDFAEQTFSAIEAYNKITQLFFYQKRLWTYDGKGASRELKHRDEKFHREYLSSLSSFFNIQNKQDIITFLKNNLKNLGGELHFNTTRKTREKCNGNILVIHIHSSSSDPDNKKVRFITNRLCSFLQNHLKKSYFFSILHPTNGIYPTGSYTIINEDKEVIEEYILPKINLFHYNDPISKSNGLIDNWQYPFNINPLETFGNYSTQTLVCKHLFTIHSICMKDTITKSPSEKIQLVIYVLEHYECLISLQNENWSKFWAAVFDIYIKTHLNKMLPTSNLECISELKRTSIAKKYKCIQNRQKTEKIKKISDSLSEIEIFYQTNKEHLQLASYSGFYNSEEEKMFYVLFKLVDMTMDMFHITEKALVAYTLVKKNIR